MKGIFKAVVLDMNFNELRVALLAILGLTSLGQALTFKDLEEIIDEAKRS